jgi:hypothetical protein
MKPLEILRNRFLDVINEALNNGNIDCPQEESCVSINTLKIADNLLVAVEEVMRGPVVINVKIDDEQLEKVNRSLNNPSNTEIFYKPSIEVSYEVRN